MFPEPCVRLRTGPSGEHGVHAPKPAHAFRTMYRRTIDWLLPVTPCIIAASCSIQSHADPLVPDDRGRRHITMAVSATEEFRPCRRVLTPGFSGATHPRPRGLLRIEPSPRATPRPTGLRTNADASRRSGYDVPDPGLVVRVGKADNWGFTSWLTRGRRKTDCPCWNRNSGPTRE